MKLKEILSKGSFIAAFLTLTLSWPLSAFAVSTITISSSGDGVFTLQGVGIEDASALEISVFYDTASLANPRVVEGPLITGAMTAINPNVAGTVRIVIISITPIKGSGTIATLTFDRTSSSPGKISALKARLANIKGAPLLSAVQVNNPSEAVADAGGSSQAGNISSGTTTSPIGIGLPGAPATMPSETALVGQPSVPDTTLSPGQEPAIEALKTNSSLDTGETTTKTKTPLQKIYTQKSILERFKEFKGARTAEALISLFDQESMIGWRQEPSVALSDGKSAVKVAFISMLGNIAPSDVAVTGAKLLSLKRDPDNTNTWIVELLPEKGGDQASIAISQGELKMIYPLTIAPKVNMDFIQSGKLTKADFDAYIKKRIISRSSGPGMKRDYSRNYRDDYIVTANYLYAIEKAQRKK